MLAPLLRFMNALIRHCVLAMIAFWRLGLSRHVVWCVRWQLHIFVSPSSVSRSLECDSVCFLSSLISCKLCASLPRCLNSVCAFSSSDDSVSSSDHVTFQAIHFAILFSSTCLNAIPFVLLFCSECASVCDFSFPLVAVVSSVA